MMGYWNDGNGWTNGFGMLVMLLVWAGLIGLTVWAVTRMTGSNTTASTTLESPRQILDRRFAAGELDAEQYAAARRVLEGRSIDDGASRS
jgi:putative membrane protein